MSAAILRQDIVTWYTPEEKLPDEDVFVVVTFSGKVGNREFDHAIGTGLFYDHGWDVIDVGEIDYRRKDNTITIDAWCDLKPYQG